MKNLLTDEEQLTLHCYNNKITTVEQLADDQWTTPEIILKHVDSEKLADVLQMSADLLTKDEYMAVEDEYDYMEWRVLADKYQHKKPHIIREVSDCGFLRTKQAVVLKSGLKCFQYEMFEPFHHKSGRVYLANCRKGSYLLKNVVAAHFVDNPNDYKHVQNRNTHEEDYWYKGLVWVETVAEAGPCRFVIHEEGTGVVFKVRNLEKCLQHLKGISGAKRQQSGVTHGCTVFYIEDCPFDTRDLLEFQPTPFNKFVRQKIEMRWGVLNAQTGKVHTTRNLSLFCKKMSLTKQYLVSASSQKNVKFNNASTPTRGYHKGFRIIAAIPVSELPIVGVQSFKQLGYLTEKPSLNKCYAALANIYPAASVLFLTFMCDYCYYNNFNVFDVPRMTNRQQAMKGLSIYHRAVLNAINDKGAL